MTKGREVESEFLTPEPTMERVQLTKAGMTGFRDITSLGDSDGQERKTNG